MLQVFPESNLKFQIVNLQCNTVRKVYYDTCGCLTFINSVYLLISFQCFVTMCGV